MVSKVRNFWLCVFSGVVATTLIVFSESLVYNHKQFENFSVNYHESLFEPLHTTGCDLTYSCHVFDHFACEAPESGKPKCIDIGQVC